MAENFPTQKEKINIQVQDREFQTRKTQEIHIKTN